MSIRRQCALLPPLLGVLVLCAALAAPCFASPVSAKKARLRAVEARLQTVGTESEIVVEKYDEANTRLSSVKQQVAANGQLLRVAERNLSLATEQLTARARDMYKSPDASLLDVIFGTGSFNALVTEMNMMQRLNTSDIDTVNAVAAYRQDIRDRRVTLVADRQAAAKLLAARAAQKQHVLALQGKLRAPDGGHQGPDQAAAGAAGGRVSRRGAARRAGHSRGQSQQQ